MTLEQKIRKCALIMMREVAKERNEALDGAKNWTKETDEELLARVDGPDVNLDIMVQIKVNDQGRTYFDVRMEDSFICAPVTAQAETLDECWDMILECLENYKPKERC